MAARWPAAIPRKANSCSKRIAPLVTRLAASDIRLVRTWPPWSAAAPNRCCSTCWRQTPRSIRDSSSMLLQPRVARFSMASLRAKRRPPSRSAAPMNKTTTILRVDIDEIHSTGKSLMPEGFEKVIDKKSMANLLSFLQQAAVSQGAAK